MPNKHNASRHHHIPKMKCPLKNWAEYDAGLRRRGYLTLWLTTKIRMSLHSAKQELRCGIFECDGGGSIAAGREQIPGWPRTGKPISFIATPKCPGGFRALNVSVERASTVIFPDCESAVGGWNVEADGYTYGIHGTPTVLALAGRIAELEGGMHTLLVPSGLAALTLVDMAMLSAGSHVLIPDNVYVPNRLLAVKLLHRFGVEASFYPADGGAAVAEYFRSNTHLIWVESPGSITMEVQDVPAISAAAHARGVMVAMDNTWARGCALQALRAWRGYFRAGVDEVRWWA